MKQEIINYVKSRAKSFEIYYSEAEMFNIEIFNNKPNFISGGSSRGMGVRVIHDKKIGFAYTNSIDNYKECVEKALSIAKVSKEDPNFKNFAFPQKYKRLSNINKELASFNEDNFVNFNEAFLSNVKSVDERISINSGSYVKETEKIRVVNSEGVDFEEERVENAFDCSLGIKFEGKLESIDMAKCDIKKIDPVIGIENAKRLMGVLNKQELSSSTMQLLLHPEAVSSLFEQSFVFAVNAENAQEGKSVFAGKLGQAVCNPLLDITDDGIAKGLFCTRSCDCEGTLSQKTPLIKKGVLKNFLYDTYTANKDGIKSTGNAYRSVASLPSIDVNNFMISPGNKSAIINDVEKGLLVRNLLGAHTMNAPTGDFSLAVNEGYYINKGEVIFPVKDVMIAGKFFELIKDVTALSKEVEHCFAGTGGFYVPYILFPKIAVIGKKA